MQNASLVRREICLLVLNVDIAGVVTGKKKKKKQKEAHKSCLQPFDTVTINYILLYRDITSIMFLLAKQICRITISQVGRLFLELCYDKCTKSVDLRHNQGSLYLISAIMLLL